MLCNYTTATSLATQANIVKLLQSVNGEEKISMKVDVKDQSCAPIAMVPAQDCSVWKKEKEIQLVHIEKRIFPEAR